MGITIRTIACIVGMSALLTLSVGCATGPISLGLTAVGDAFFGLFGFHSLTKSHAVIPVRSSLLPSLPSLLPTQPMSLPRVGHGVHTFMDGEFFQQVVDVVLDRLGLDI